MYIPTIPGNKKHSIPIWLVVSTTLKKIEFVRLDHHQYWGEYKSCSKPPTRYIMDYYWII